MRDARGGVRDMDSYSISVLKWVVEDGFTSDPGYDEFVYDAGESETSDSQIEI